MIYIFGVSGFVGHHLAKACSNTDEVFGFGHAKLESADELNEVLKGYQAVDLASADEVNRNVNLTGVDTIFHLAGLAAVGPSYDQPARYISSNTTMFINLAEKALIEKSKARFIVISSGSIYNPNQPLPISEDGKLSATSPYSISKISTELLGEYYRSRGLDIVIARPFNHIGPGQGSGFILPDLVEQAKNYPSSGKFVVGNLKTKRDYTDVRDVVEAYSALAKAKTLKHLTYNICSGESYSGEMILAEICNNFSIENPTIEIDQKKLRPGDIEDIRGDNSRVLRDTSWSPRISIQQSVKDFITDSLQ